MLFIALLMHFIRQQGLKIGLSHESDSMFRNCGLSTWVDYGWHFGLCLLIECLFNLNKRK